MTNKKLFSFWMNWIKEKSSYFTFYFSSSLYFHTHTLSPSHAWTHSRRNPHSHTLSRILSPLFHCGLKKRRKLKAPCLEVKNVFTRGQCKRRRRRRRRRRRHQRRPHRATNASKTNFVVHSLPHFSGYCSIRLLKQRLTAKYIWQERWCFLICQDSAHFVLFA